MLQVVVPDTLTGAFEREVPAALALGKRSLEAPALADVPRYADQPDDLAAVISHRELCGPQPLGRTGFVDPVLFHVDHRRSGRDDLLLDDIETLCHLRWEKIEVGLADQVLRPL